MIYLIVTIFTLQWLLMLFLIKETSPKPASQANSETSLKGSIPQRTWQREIETMLETLPLNDTKKELVNLIQDSNNPVDFMDMIENELEELNLEVSGRDKFLSPFGSGFCANRHFGGRKGRIYKYLPKSELNNKATAYYRLYNAIVECKI